eukprot:12987467-Alexandrium_andersonii.AAC.1
MTDTELTTNDPRDNERGDLVVATIVLPGPCVAGDGSTVGSRPRASVVADARGRGGWRRPRR